MLDRVRELKRRIAKANGDGTKKSVVVPASLLVDILSMLDYLERIEENLTQPEG